MDNDLVDFLVTIPPHTRLEQKIYKKMIAYAFPTIRDIPCTNSGRPVDPRFVREYLFMALNYAARKALGPLARTSVKGKSLGRAPRNLADAFRAEPRLMDDVLCPLLRMGVFPSEIFNHAGIDAVIDEHFRGGAAHEEILARLISWGLAVKFFLHGDLADAPTDLYQG